MSHRNSFRLPGLTPATFTPMSKDGSVNLDRIGNLVDFLIDERVSALFVLGSTGEGLSLTISERQRVAQAYVEAAAGRLPVVIHTGHNSLEEACVLAQHAQKVGADAISAIAPFYFKPDSTGTLIQCLARITGAAPDLPFYYYHIPGLTGTEIDLAEFVQRCADELPNMVGVKFSDPRLHPYLAIRSGGGAGNMDFLFGVDEMLLSAWTAGMRGAVGSTYNFAAPLYLRIISCFKQGQMETARNLQSRAAAMIDTILRTCGRPGFKAVMKIIGLDCGPHRLPLVSPDPSAIARMTDALEAMGFFDWGRKP